MKILSQEKIRKIKGCDCVLQQLADDHFKWCVQYAGNGHYFKTHDEALAYLIARGFIR